MRTPKTFFFLLAVIGVGVLVLILYTTFFRKPKTQYERIVVQRHALVITIQATGTIEPQNKVEILPPIAGRIDEILVGEGETVSSGEVIAWMSSTNRAALLDLARAKDRKELQKWKESYKPTPITAPVTGTIIQKNVVPGQTVNQQTILFEMSDQLVIRAEVDETDIGKIKQDMEANVTVDSFPETPFDAHVTLISHQSKVINNVTIYEVELLPKHLAPGVRAGMTANVDFVLLRKNDALTVPLWITQGQEQQEITVLDASKHPKTITVGQSNGKWVEVLSGVVEDDVVFVPRQQFVIKETGQSPFSPWRRRRGSTKGKQR